MEEPGFIKTKWSMLNNKPAEEFKVTVFEPRKRKLKNKSNLQIDDKTNISDEDGQEKGFDIKRVKHEMIKFAMTGFAGKKKEEINAEMLIKLGAKPPKRKNRNYKEILEEKRKSLKHAAADKEFQQAGKNSVGVCIAKKKSKKRNWNTQKEGKGSFLKDYGVVRPKNK